MWKDPVAEGSVALSEERNPVSLEHREWCGE